MKTKLGFGKSAKCESKAKSIIAIMFFLVFISCLKNEPGLQDNETLKDPDLITLQGLSSDCSFRHMILYYGHVIFRRGYGTPVVETRIISNPDFSCYQDKFVLMIRSGHDQRSRVTSGEVWIDGKLVVRQSDFNKHAFLIVKYISGLTPESKLEVKLNGTPGSYLDLWIEGTKTNVTPLFEQIGPVCQNSTPPMLPSGSINSPAVTGKWDPEVISTTSPGIKKYVFTPSVGQCSLVVTMEIEVLSSVVPVFEQIGPLTLGSIAPALSNTSINGVTGTWDPKEINTATSGSVIFTFTPSAGQCASISTMIIEVESTDGISDMDGYIYKTVKIGEQLWMAENLRTTRYNNGDIISTTIPATSDLSNESEPKYQWAYDGNENNVNIYGRLYTWYAVTDSRGVCPVGWHIPTDAEWIYLTDYLINNGYGYEGNGTDIAKSMASRESWEIDATQGNVGNDQTSNNRSGFTALPGGIRYADGLFMYINNYAVWWSSSEVNSSINALYRCLLYDRNYMQRTYFSKRQGVYVRCTKDN